MSPGSALRPFQQEEGPAPPGRRASAPGRAPEGITSSTSRARLRTRSAAAAALLTIATLAVASTAPARPEPTAPPAAVTAAAPYLIDPAAEARDLMTRAARARRTPAPPPAVAAPPPAAPVTQTRTPRRTVKKAAPAPRQRHPKAATATVAAPTDGSRAAVVIAFALAQVGKPYIWASAGPRGYDCSGLVLASYARVGIPLPHQSGSIASRGRPVPRGQWAPGDVLVWRGHVALYLGGNRMVTAPGRGRTITVAAVYGSPTARRLL